MKGNLQLIALPKEATKSNVLTHTKYGALFLVAQLCNHGCIATFTSTNVTMYNKKNGTSNEINTRLLNQTMDNRSEKRSPS